MTESLGWTQLEAQDSACMLADENWKLKRETNSLDCYAGMAGAQYADIALAPGSESDLKQEPTQLRHTEKKNPSISSDGIQLPK